MLNHALMASFRDELEKEGAVPLPLALGAAGAIGAGGYALKNMVEDFKKDQFMHDMGQMTPEVYRMRRNRRLAIAGTSAVLGGAAGASAPLLVSKLRMMTSARLKDFAGQAEDVAKERGGEAMRAGVDYAGKAGTNFADKAAKKGKEHIGDLGAAGAEGAYRKVKEMGGLKGLF